MNIFRSEENPTITPEDIKPSRSGFKVISVFNCGVTRFNSEILLLMRVAEIPISSDLNKKPVPILDIKTDKLVVKEFGKADSLIDFSDSRFVRTSTELYKTKMANKSKVKNKTFKILDTGSFIFPFTTRNSDKIIYKSPLRRIPITLR